VPPHAAKRDPRLRESGPLQSFQWQNQVFPLEPKTVFYDWIYLTALTENPNLAERLLDYDSFTDIEFNPEKSINCQAKSCALFVSLHREGYLTQVLNSPEDFIAMFKDPSPGGQLTLF
jgi:type I restriction enzyme M protein